MESSGAAQEAEMEKERNEKDREGKNISVLTEKERGDKKKRIGECRVGNKTVRR